MIQIQTAKVYYAPTKARRYFTTAAAIKAEALAIISKKQPKEDFEPETVFVFDITIDDRKRFKRMMSSMIYKLKVSK